MDATEVKKLIKELQTATSSGKPEDAITILKTLKKDVVATEDLLRETKAGLAIGKLRSHSRKEIADLAKELVKKWKEAVEAAKKAKTGASVAPAATDAAKPPVKKQPSTLVGKSNTSSPQPPAPSLPPLEPPPRKLSVTTSSAVPAAKAPQTPVTPVVSSDPNAVRTVKTDAVKISSKGDKVRDKCLELLYDAMAMDSGAPTEQILKRAEAIEYSVYSEFDGVNKEYNQKMRRLCLNLKDKKNPGLRAAVVSGDIKVDRFVKMSPEEMASEERKQQNNAINQQNVHNALGAGEPEAETDAFQCGRCKNFKTRYRQAQTRSADEPMTVRFSCTVCGNKYEQSSPSLD
ncbi:transcription elongation factor S-II [Ceratobasidium sp. AG-Ba]|nr:transcription elongation factor S-II [Ceratobasidium sp. AG-Ba]